MAIVKHIKSRNANYSAAINYLLFEHDEKNGKKIVDESGNIHTHIVINSVRKTAVERQPYMDKPHEEAAGYKHRSTDKFMSTFKKTVMDRCQQEGLHQIDLLAPAERKITQKEYMAQKHDQQKLNEINQKIIEDGLKPTSTVFLTQKEYLRNAIDECAATSNSFDEFQAILLLTRRYPLRGIVTTWHQPLKGSSYSFITWDIFQHPVMTDVIKASFNVTFQNPFRRSFS